MNILITGAQGFVGRNLASQLKNIRDGKAGNYAVSGKELSIFEYDLNSSPEELDDYCRKADFVFNLAGVNRPKDQPSSCREISASRQRCFRCCVNTETPAP